MEAMENDKEFSICRLCLGGNGTLIYVFHSDVIDGCMPADVISHLMQFQVFKNDAYPPFACLECMGKLKDFKVFKEMCITSRELFDRAYTAKYVSIKGAGSEEIPIKNGICEDELTLRTLEVIAANATLLEPKKESEEYPLGGDSGSDDNLSCVSEWEEVPINPAPIPLEEVETIDGYSEAESADEPTYCKSDDDRASNVPEWEGVSVHHAPVSLKERRSVHEGSIEPMDDHCSTQTIEKDVEIQEDVLQDPINDSVLCDSQAYNLRQREQLCNTFKFNEHALSFVSTEGLLTYRDKRDEGLVKKRFSCDICSKDYAKRSSLWRHQKTKHVHWCNICGKIFSNELSLKTHKVTHEREVVRNFGCNECLRMFAKLPHLGIHVRSHRGALPLPCPLCDVRFSVKCDLHKHFKTEHKGSMEVTYNCVDCGSLKPDTQKVEPSAKESGVVEEPNNECFSIHSTEKEGEFSENLLHDPVINDQTFIPCTPEQLLENDRCELTFASTGDRVSIETPQALEEFPKKRYGCVIGSKGSDILESGDAVDANKRKRGEELHCPTCDKIYTSRRSFKSHVLTHRQGKIYECRHCGKLYDLKSSLAVHTNSAHTGETYVCNVCGRKFKCNSALQSHAAIHGERKFKCDVCDKTYCRKNDLLQNQKTHIVGKSNVCEICGKAYNVWVLFLKHRRRHREKTWALCTCKVCGKTFSDKYILWKHVETHSSKYSCTI